MKKPFTCPHCMALFDYFLSRGHQGLFCPKCEVQIEHHEVLLTSDLPDHCRLMCGGDYLQQKEVACPTCWHRLTPDQHALILEYVEVARAEIEVKFSEFEEGLSAYDDCLNFVSGYAASAKGVLDTVLKANAPMPEPKELIIKVRIVHPADGESKIFATYTTGAEHEILNYNPEQMAFSEKEFIGLTIIEAGLLYARRQQEAHVART